MSVLPFSPPNTPHFRRPAVHIPTLLPTAVGPERAPAALQVVGLWGAMAHSGVAGALSAAVADVGGKNDALTHPSPVHQPILPASNTRIYRINAELLDTRCNTNLRHFRVLLRPTQYTNGPELSASTARIASVAPGIDRGYLALKPARRRARLVPDYGVNLIIVSVFNPRRRYVGVRLPGGCSRRRWRYDWSRCCAIGR